MEQAKSNIGLVLSGGGVRGAAHIGLIKLLEEIDFEPNHIAGTSAGALVGGLYAAGYNSTQIQEFFATAKLFNWKNYAVGKAGLLDPMKYLPILQQYFPEDDFGALQKKLFITRTNLETGALEIISSGKLLLNMLASSALPMVFAPVKIYDTYYADGGIVNNFPTEPLRPLCDVMIGAYVNPLGKKTQAQLHHTFEVVERAFHISISGHSIPKFKDCDLTLVPDELNHYSLVDTRHVSEIVEIGYRAALKCRSDLLALKRGIVSTKS